MRKYSLTEYLRERGMNVNSIKSWIGSNDTIKRVASLEESTQGKENFNAKEFIMQMKAIKKEKTSLSFKNYVEAGCTHVEVVHGGSKGTSLSAPLMGAFLAHIDATFCQTLDERVENFLSPTPSKEEAEEIYVYSVTKEGLKKEDTKVRRRVRARRTNTEI